MSGDALHPQGFGERRPGTSERVLARARGGALGPFDWLARAVSANARRVLDVQSGTGALMGRLSAPGRLVVGVELSWESLEHRQRHDATFVQADLAHLPFSEDSFDSVVTSLGLGVVENRDVLLAEAARVLRPGGVLAALTPSLRPLDVDDLKLSSQVTRLLRVMPQVPGSAEFRAKRALRSVGLTKVEDSRARFHFDVSNREDARALVDGMRSVLDQARAENAVDFLASRAADGVVRFPLPMRRIVAIK
ncbi:MAG: methyltransferase domain-containing protein [Arachnia sp.]